MNPIQHTRRRGYYALLAAAGAVIVALLLGSIAVTGENGDEASATPPTSVPSDEDDVRECGDTWLIVQSDNDHNRWFADGVTAIREADSPEKARNAAHEWLSLVRRDPQLLAAASAYFLDREVETSTLVDGKCASQAAETLTAEIELAIAEAKVTPSEAPADGYNSGTNDGNVVTATNPGISGDRTAILIELPDGTKIWIMARCGNPVVTEKPPVPEGPTDEPEEPTTTTTVPLTPKDPTVDVNRPQCGTPDRPPCRVIGPGTTPVGTDPGPAEDPCDTPTGYCEGDQPTTTTTTQPSGGGSGGSTTTSITVPSCGQEGQPSCDNTGVTPPTTEAPPPAPPNTTSPTTVVTSP